MAGRSRTVTIAVLGDTSQLKRELAKADAQMATLGDSARKASLGLQDLFVGTAAVLGVKKLVTAASDLEQAVGGTAAVFGDASDAIDQFAKSSVDLVGLSESAARSLTTRLGASLKAAGLSASEAADRSVELVTIGADLAATFGGTTEEAVTALGAALRGEYDPLERFGVALKQADVNARAGGEGADKLAKSQAALELILEGSADAAGQFARESETFAVQQQKARAQIENTAAELGNALLPAASDAAGAIATLAKGFSALPDSTQSLLVLGTGLAAAWGPLSSVFGNVANAAKTAATQIRTLQLSTGQVVGVAAAAVVGLDALWEISKDLTGITAEVTDSFQDLTIAIEDADVAATTEQFRRLAQALAEDDNYFRQVVESFGLFGGDVEDSAARLDAFNDILAESPGAAQALVDQLRAAGEIDSSELDNYQQRLDQTKDSQVAGSIAQQEWNDSVSEGVAAANGADTSNLVLSLADVEKQAKESAKALDDIRTAASLLFNANRAYTDAQTGVSRADSDLVRAKEDLADAQSKVTDENYTAEDKARDVADAQRGLEDAQRNVEDASLDLVDATVAVQEQQAALRGETWDTTDATNALRDALVAQADAVGPGSVAYDDLQAYIALLDLAIASANNLETQQRAERQGDLLRQPGVGGLTARAAGGPVMAGAPYLVGEKGPELFVPNANGTIVPNGGAGNVTINADGLNVDQALALWRAQEARLMAGVR